METNPGMFSTKKKKLFDILNDMGVGQLSGNIYSGSELNLKRLLCQQLKNKDK